MAKNRRSKPKKVPDPTMRAGFILAVDIVEFAPRKSPAASLNEVVRLVNECPTFSRALSSGWVVRSPIGDGFVLAFSEDPTSPLQCALELRTKVVQRLDLKVRFGIHIGPISDVRADITGNRSVAGEGVTNAVEALEGCGANEIVLTRRAHEFIREDPRFTDSFEEPETIVNRQGDKVSVVRYRAGPSHADPLAGRLQTAEVLRDRALKRGKPVASVRVIAQRLKLLHGETLVALAMIPISLGIHYLFEHSPAGAVLRREGYQRLIAKLPTQNRPSPVTVLDIGDRFDQPGTETTDLHKLRELVQVVAGFKPRAIGIDIDFGFHSGPDPAVDGKYLDEDEVVLRLALDLTNKGLPVFVAVYEHLEFENKDELLGPGYADLATHPLRPDDALHGQVLMIGDLRVHNKHVIPSMPGKFAKYAEPIRPPRWLEPLVRRETALADIFGRKELSAGGLLFGPEFLLNVTTLDRVIAATVEASPSGPMVPTSSGELLNDRLVLIGSNMSDSDYFVMPVTGKRVSGPYYHAMAAVTQIESPLYEFKASVALGLATLAGVVVMLVGQISLRKSLTSRSMVNHRWWSIAASAGAVVLLILFGGWLATVCRVIWTEYLLTAILVAFHPTLDGWAEGLMARGGRGHGSSG